MSRYDKRYGSTREMRAENLANNIPPPGIKMPRTGTFGRLFRATFTEKYRYVEDIRSLSEAEKRERTYFVVRSQKWNEIKNGRRYRKYYFVSTYNDRTIFETLYRKEFKLGGCTCKDYSRECKHQKAVKLKYRRSIPRQLAVTRPFLKLKL